MVDSEKDFVFDRIKNRLLAIDPTAWCERYLTLDGKPFRLNGNGYKPFSDIYRYIGIKALEKDALPVIISKGRQVGASTMASALEMYFMGCGLFGTDGNAPIRIVHTYPHLAGAYSYSKSKLNAMIASSVVVSDEKMPKGTKPKSYMQSLLDTASQSNDSLEYKQFVGGNHIWIESMGLDASRLRGRTADVMFIDEIQDVPRAALANSVKILSKAQYGPYGEGIQVYFGTPKQKGSVFWEMWNQSSQQYYYLGCAKCKKHFPLYTPGTNDWEEIWLYGYIVRCTHCGFEQDKRDAAERGKWTSIKDTTDCKMHGFALNQLFMPDYSKEKIISEKPGNSAINTERAYQNEVLGEFFHGEASIISPEQVRDICGDPERKMRKHITSADDLLVFLGVDIGAKNDLEQLADSNKSAQGQSYSTAVIIAMTGPQRMSIEFATKFVRNDPASKKQLIDELMRRYSCNLAICDIGFAYDFNQIMQTEYGDRFLASQSMPRVNNHIKFNDQTFPKIIAFEKDFWIADLYEQMKKGNVRFPMGDYEKVAWLIQHCTSMEIKPSISRTGDVMPHYVKGSTPNDGFAALLNAYIAYKFYVSNGFKITHPTQMDDSMDRRPPVLSVHLPRMR
jgi:phage terminase large subunit GpA